MRLLRYYALHLGTEASVQCRFTFSYFRGASNLPRNESYLKVSLMQLRSYCHLSPEHICGIISVNVRN